MPQEKRVLRHYHFFYVSTDVKWKTCSSSYFSLLTTVVYSRTVCLHETNFPCEGGHSIAHSILKTCAQQRKGHFGLFLDTNTGVHLLGGSRGSRPLPFFCTVQIMSSNYLTDLEETLWKISLNNERIQENDVSTAFSWSFSTLL